eukprot:139595-Pleurochrysis_carterae.AAC.1
MRCASLRAGRGVGMVRVRCIENGREGCERARRKTAAFTRRMQVLGNEDSSLPPPAPAADTSALTPPPVSL